MFADMQTPEGSKLGKMTHNFMTAITPQIDKSNPLMNQIDRTGKQQAYEFDQFVQSKVDEYRRAKKNPYDLFIPGKPDYLGKPEVIRRFQKPLDQSMQTIRDIMTPGAPKPAKTIDATNPPIPNATFDKDKGYWVTIGKDGKRFIVREQ